MNLIGKLSCSGENSKIIYKNIIGAFFVKGFSLIVSFLTTPLFIHYFNDNQVLGVWYTLLSVLIWFLNFDLGLGNGIRNSLVKDIAAKDYESARKTISSGMFSVGIVSIVLAIIGCIFIFFINLNQLFNVDQKLISSHALLLSSIFVFIAIMVRFFLTTISSVFYALQKSFVNNFLALCVSILQLVYVLVVKSKNVEVALINISFAYIFLSNLPVVIAGIIVFRREMKPCIPSLKYVSKKHINAIMSIGILFFLCQLLYMMIANTNEFFITNLYGAEYTAEYTFYYKLTTIGTMVGSLALTPIWSVVTKAQSEGNFVWLRKLYGKIKLAGLGILFIQIALVPFIPFLMDVWLGNGTVEVKYMTAIAFTIFSTVFLYSGMLSTIANGLAMMKIQTITYTIGVIIKVAMLLLLYSFTDWDFVIWTNIIILLPYVVTQQIALNRYFKTKNFENENTSS